MSSEQVVSLMRRVNALEHRARIHYVDYRGMIGDPATYGYYIRKHIGKDGLIYQNNRFILFYPPPTSSVMKVFSTDNALIRTITLNGFSGGEYFAIDNAGGIVIYGPTWRGLARYSSTTGATLWYDDDMFTGAGTLFVCVAADGTIFVSLGGTCYRVSSSGAIQNSWSLGDANNYPIDFEEATQTLWVWDRVTPAVKQYSPYGVAGATFAFPDPGAQDVTVSSAPYGFKVDARRVFHIAYGEFVTTGSGLPLQRVGPYSATPPGYYERPFRYPSVTAKIPAVGTLCTFYGDYMLTDNGHLFRLGSIGETTWANPEDAYGDINVERQLPIRDRINPDHGIDAPPLDLWGHYGLHPEPIKDLRWALTLTDAQWLHRPEIPEGIPAQYQNELYGLWSNRPLWRYYLHPSTGALYTWQEGDEDNSVYRKAMGDRSAYGGTGEADTWTQTFTPSPTWPHIDGPFIDARCCDIDIGEPYEIIKLLEGSNLHYEMDE